MKKILNIVFVALFLVGAILVGNSVGASSIITVSVVLSASLLIKASGLELGFKTGFDISEVVSQLGAYARKYEAQIWTEVKRGLVFEQYMRKVPNITSQYVMTASSNTEFLQPFQKAWTPKGSVDFKPRINSVNQIKIDYLIENMNEIYDSYLQFLVDEKKLPNQQPFVKYIVDNHIIPSITEELDLISAKGVHATPTPGTAGASIACTDGILTIVADEITATNLTPITTGVITATNAVDKVELFNDTLPSKYSEMSGNIYMSKTMEKFYKRDYRNTFGLTNDQNAKNQTKIDATNKVIVGLECFEGSQRILFTPDNNMLCMYDQILTPTNLDIQLEKRNVNVLGDFKRGYGFGTLETVFVNDQA
jgi:hypothetical protein